MLTQKVTGEIIQALRFLPPDKVREALDFILTLKENFGYDQPVDESAEWTEADMCDARTASLQRFDQDDPFKEAHD